MIDRRQFLQTSGLISLAPWIPAFLPGTVKADAASKDGHILVVIQLDGGNDSLNTVIPFADENYAKYRQELKVKTQDVLKLSDSIGLHPRMREAAKLFEDGQFTIFQGVGYPNPNRSHFESMATWHRALLDDRHSEHSGWLGRAADAVTKREGADSIYIGDEAIPVALKGRRATPVSLERESDLELQVPLTSSKSQSSSDDLSNFITRTQAESFAAARQFEQSQPQNDSAAKYPPTRLARRLQLVSHLIKLGLETRVYYALQSGYDTHSVQLNSHGNLLSEFSDAVAAFLADLKASQLADGVMILAFSEFGRRVQENGSAGTDHGAAGPVFLAGSKLHRRLVGDHPSLSDLDEGDLKMSIDFRSVYATVLTDWLDINADHVLGAGYASLDLFSV